MTSIVYWHGDSLYLNITNECSNHCYFCFRNFISGVWGFDLKFPSDKEPTFNEIIMELQRTINKKVWKEIVFCGFGEPTERLDCLLEVVSWIKRFYGNRVRLNTNGQAFLSNPNRDVIDELREVGLDMISVSLNAHDRDTYIKVCNPQFDNAYESVLEFIKKAKIKLDAEVTAVTIPEVNMRDLEEKVKEMGVKFRIRVYEPLII